MIINKGGQNNMAPYSEWLSSESFMTQSNTNENLITSIHGFSQSTMPEEEKKEENKHRLTTKILLFSL